MSNIKVRVGQQNSIKVVSSVSGSAGGAAIISENVIGGIASVTSLTVSGLSTFTGISTFQNTIFAQNLSIRRINYLNYNSNGIAYFNATGILTYTGSPASAGSVSNYLLTIDNFGAPSWTNMIDGGTY